MITWGDILLTVGLIIGGVIAWGIVMLLVSIKIKRLAEIVMASIFCIVLFLPMAIISLFIKTPKWKL